MGSPDLKITTLHLHYLLHVFRIIGFPHGWPPAWLASRMVGLLHECLLHDDMVYLGLLGI